MVIVVAGRGRKSSQKEILPLLQYEGSKEGKIISCLTGVLVDSAEDSQRPRVASRALTVFGLPNSPEN